MIGKAPGSFAFKIPSLDITAQNLTDKLPLVKKGDGAIHIAWFDDLMIDASVISDTEISISAVRCGSTSIAVYIEEGTNYTASPILSYDRININYVDPVLANNSPQIIQMAARTGQAANFWSIGDAIPLHIEGQVAPEGTYKYNANIYAKIIGFNHNKEIEGDNTIHFAIAYSPSSVAAISCRAFKVNETATTVGGWEASYMRNAICPLFLAAMPQEWQDVIMPCPKYRDNVGGTERNGSQRMSILNDKIWVPSYSEIRGNGSNDPDKGFVKQYDYFKNISSRDKGIKLMSTEGIAESGNLYVATSTPLYGSGSDFMVISDLGNTCMSATYNIEFMPCWVVG